MDIKVQYWFPVAFGLIYRIHPPPRSLLVFTDR